jgi:Amt family ammonium transporter
MKTKSKWLSMLTILAAFILGLPAVAFAADAPTMNSGDTAFMIICAALVMIMTPGLAFFYGGMVRKKNVMGTIMQSFAALALVSVQWVLLGYTLSFGPDMHHLLGGLSFLGLSGVTGDPSANYATTIPHFVFVFYQLMFAIITVALISGAFAERMRFSIFVAFVLLLSMIRWRTGYGLRMAGSSTWEHWILPAVLSFISAPVSQDWWPPFYWGAGTSQAQSR